jgi:hypothetical protein
MHIETWPQWFMVITVLIGLVVHIVKNINEKDAIYKALGTIIGKGFILYVLYCGEFFK